jgi:hypothetical protein
MKDLVQIPDLQRCFESAMVSFNADLNAGLQIAVKLIFSLSFKFFEEKYKKKYFKYRNRNKFPIKYTLVRYLGTDNNKKTLLIKDQGC